MVLTCGFVPAAAFPAGVEGETPTLPTSWTQSLRWRSIGPANMGGRCVAVAHHPTDAATFWVATASGGLLKTTNNGTTYEHQFDRETTVSLGHVAVATSNPDVVWVGTGEANPRNSVSHGDGVYKSTDGGKSWKHMGLEESYQIGRIAIHPENPDVVWVGALGRLYGPNEERGLFKTTDGGETWERVLYVDENTGVIDVDLSPADPDVLLVATYERQRDGFDTNDPAKKWGPGGGIWRTTDGGGNWARISAGLPTCQLGRIGIDWYRGDAAVVYAVVESERIALAPDDAAFIGMRGEDAEVGARVRGVTDGGPAEAAGLLEGDVILAVDGQDVIDYEALVRYLRDKKPGDTVSVKYVREREFQIAEVVLGERPEDVSGSAFSSGLGGQRENVQQQQGRGAEETGGIYKSTDGGVSWTRINSLNPRPMYYSQIRVDPGDAQRVYVLGTALYRSADGGATFTPDGGGDDVHVDHHGLWIDPADGRHMILTNDGGIYVTHDRMESWDHHCHVAIGQFYHAAVDTRELYHAYGGLQDNGSWGGPNRTRTSTGPVNSDWFRVGGGDGFICRVDPEDPDLVYYESQNGGMGRTHLRTREGGFMRPSAPRGTRYRFNWETPFLLSSFNSRIHYSAGNHVFRSIDRGNRMKAISPEITRTQRGSATALAESPRDPDVLYVGTDDGALWVTTDGGAEWKNLIGPPEEVPEEPSAGDEGEVAAEGGEEQAAAAETEKPAPKGKPVYVGKWSGKLKGEGIPEEGSGFELELELADGKIKGELRSSKVKGPVSEASFDAESRVLTVTFDTDAGSVGLRAEVRGKQMEGTLEMGGGLLRIPFEAERDDSGDIGAADTIEAAEFLELELAPGAPAAPATASAQAGGEADETAKALAGTWKATMQSDDLPQGAGEFEIVITVEDGKIGGTVISAFGESEITQASFKNDKLEFVSVSDQGEARFEAELKDGKLSGTLTAGGGAFTMDFEAHREAPPEPREAAQEPRAAEPRPAAEPAAEEPQEEQPAQAEEKEEEKKGPTLEDLLPGPMWVSSIEASRHKSGRVYVAVDGHRSDDDEPHVLVSEDFGESWKSLRANLPRGSARVLREDLANEDLLYLGTEFGAFVSVDRGASWTRMEGDFPTVAVHDFAQHDSVPDVVVATHGRSLWVLDVSALRGVGAETIGAKAHLYAPRRAVRWRSDPSPGASGLRRFVGENPPSGLDIYYSLGSKAREVRLTITDAAGETLRQIDLEEGDGKGLHRAYWDLRRQPNASDEEEQQQEEGEEPRPRRRRRGGFPVPTGSYRVVLEVDGETHTRSVEIVADPDFPEAARALVEGEEDLD